MKYISNLEEIVQGLELSIEGLKDSDKLLRQAAFDSVALISDRVQQDGLKANETPIQSFYSVGYAKKRRKKGLQTRYVDLTFSGDLMADFVPAPEGKDFVAGFRSEKQAQIAEYNELRFGTIFNLSNLEVEIVMKGIDDIVDDSFR